MLEKSHGPVGELVIDWLGGFNHCRRSYNLFFFLFYFLDGVWIFLARSVSFLASFFVLLAPSESYIYKE